MGLVVGLLIGLALALGVALYVTKVPVPFVNKVPQRTAEQDAAETENNKNWDPNAPLDGKPPAARPRPRRGRRGAAAPAAAPRRPRRRRARRGAAAAPARAGPAARRRRRRRPGARVAASSQRRRADPFDSTSCRPAPTPPEDAEQQRARLAMIGFEAK